MKRWMGGLLATTTLLLGVLAVYVHGRIHAFETTQVTEDLHVIYGPALAGRIPLGGNTAVLQTQRGAILVDSMFFVSQGRQLRELAEELGGGPTQAIINTHYHADHSHGNPAWADGTHVISTQRTFDYMRHFDAAYWEEEGLGTLPRERFDETYLLRVGDKTIRSLHLGTGHTGGDLVVLFVEDRVIHMGDLFFNGYFPNVDLEAGGSLREWEQTLGRILQLDFEQVIPGHGPVTDRRQLEQFQRFLSELVDEVGVAASKGLSLRDTLDVVELEQAAGYRSLWIPFVKTLDRDFVIRRAWEEATGTVEAAEVPLVEEWGSIR